MDRFHNSQDIEKFDKILLEIIKDYYLSPEKRNVSPQQDKNHFKRIFNETTPPADSLEIEEVFEEFKNTIYDYSVKTWHPLFLNQMSAGISYPAVIGDSLSAMLNPTLSTWEAAPAATIIEKNTSMWMAKVLGMPEGSSGIFLPGGSLANLVALTVARNKKLGTDCILNGIKCEQRNVILTSNATHYSIRNAANILGLGTNNIIEVATDERNEIIFEEFLKKLEFCKENNYSIIAVVLVAGNTVTGGVDRIREIAEICNKEKIHLHVDAAFGGTLALTSNKNFIDGIELADSVCWDTHKWFFSSLTATVLLFKDIELLKEIFNSDADYLFHKHTSESDDIEDQGRYSILCGKRFDALKIWFLWKLYGTTGLSQSAQTRIELVNEFYRVLSDDKDFQPSYSPVAPLLCFRFLPAAIIGETPEYINSLQKRIREEFRLSGEALFNIVLLNGEYHFRMVLINPLTELNHLINLIEKIREKGYTIINKI